jgi:translocation and assembly module TamA
MRYLCGLCLALCFVAVPVAAASSTAVLKYKLVGLEGALRKNARAWLGDPPDSPQDRANFLVTYEERLEDSLKALGYYNPEITSSLKRTEPVWSLDIEVAQGKPVVINTISLELKGIATADEAFQKLLASAPFKKDDVFNHGDYDRFKNQLLTLGQERGYFDARFLQSRVTVNIESNQVDIYLHYESGQRFRFGAVEYSEFDIDPELLAELQPIEEGDYFDQSRLQFFQAQLHRTGYFSGVVIKPLFEEAEDYQVPLSVSLYPARRHSFDVGVGYSTDTEERVSLTWRTPMVNSYGHSQQTRLSYSTVNPSGKFIYTIPLTHPLNDVLHLSVLQEDNEYGNIDSHQWEVGAQREIRSGKWIYSYSLRELTESWTLTGTDFENNYSLPGFAISHSTRVGSIVDPSGGLSQFYKLEGGGEDWGSDLNLLRTTADYRYIVTPAVDHRVVVRASLGAVFIAKNDRNNLAPSLGFFAGGSQSIRAFAYQSIGNDIDVPKDDGTERKRVIGGDRLVIASLEYQYYFSPTWRGAVFVDGGDAFDSGDFDMNVGPGFGIHYMSPVGAVRVEFANSASDDNSSWRLVLNIGAEF